MFAKLLVIVVAVGWTAAALLVIRHQRLECAHERIQVYRDMVRHEQALWELRAELARRTTPDAVRALIKTLPIEWQAIPAAAPRDGAPATPFVPDDGLVRSDLEDARAALIPAR